MKFANQESKQLKIILGPESVSESENSVIFIRNRQLFFKSNAILEISRLLSFPYNLVSLFKIIPQFARDKIYDFIAGNRYKWFGQKPSCILPDVILTDKIID